MYAGAFVIYVMNFLFAVIGALLVNAALHYGSFFAVCALIFIGYGIFVAHVAHRLPWWFASGSVTLATGLVWLVW